MAFKLPFSGWVKAFTNAAAATALKVSGAVTPVRVSTSLQSTGNPLRNLTPERLISYLDAYRMGLIKDAARTWDIQEQVDDTLRTVSRKTKGDVSRLPWEVVTIENADAAVAAKHREALLDFYNNLRATDALRGNVRGGVRLMVSQMMDAVGKGYAVHDLIWSPQPGRLRLEARFTPLWWFEGTNGNLRFLESDYQIYGRDLEKHGWLVTAVSDPLMMATSLAVLFKGLPLRAWLMFIEKFSVPGVLGTTSFPVGSPEREALETAVGQLINDWAAVKGEGDKIELLECKSSGTLPHPPLIEYLDRKIVTLWRGSDLATMAKGGEAVGASVQGDEPALLTEDAAAMIGEVLNERIDRVVLAWYFGPDVEPAAYFRLCPPKRRNIELDIKIDDALLRWGAPLSVRTTLERYNRPMPEAEDELLKAPAAPAAGFPPGLANESPTFTEEIREAVSRAVAADLKPLRERVERALHR